MAAPRLLPDSGTLRQLRNKGMTYQEIADQYGVTKGAVYWQLREIPGVVKDRPSYKDVIPWTVKAEHAHAYPALMLRLLGRRRQGKPITEEKERLLDNWLAGLKKEGLVVDYDPNVYGPESSAAPGKGGWGYVHRQSGDPQDVPIRMPAKTKQRDPLPGEVA